MFNLFVRKTLSKVHASKSHVRRFSKISANNAPNKRNLRLEQLEDRALLSVSTAEYAEIRDAYPALNLPETADSLNVIEIDSNRLDQWELQNAIYDAGDTKSDDLIVVRTTDTANTIDYYYGSIEIYVNSSTYGTLNVVAFGTQPLTLNAQGYGTVLNIQEGTVGLAHLTITNGNSCYVDEYVEEFGGDSEVIYGGDYDGGGVYVGYKCSLTVSDTTITGNVASQYGLDSTSCGGGVYVDMYGSFTAVNSTISENTAWNDGGGVYVEYEGQFTSTNTTISENTSWGNGGGVYVDSYASFTATNTTISENIAEYDKGGGVYVDTYASFTATNTTISGNFIPKWSGGWSGQGGGVFVDKNGSFTVTNVVIAGNSAGTGGGVYVYGVNDYTGHPDYGVYIYGTFTATNTTITGNSASQGGGVGGGGLFTATNTIISTNYSPDGLNLGCKLSSESSNNLKNYYPAFVCGPIFDSDGQLTNAEALDLRLRSDSPALDAGSNTAVEDVLTDLGDKTRICNGTVDIGAYEYQGDRNDKPYQTVVDTLNDSFDLDDDEWSLREAIYYAPKYVTITFAENLSGTILLTLGKLLLDKGIMIDGDRRIVIDAGQKSRIMNVQAGTEEIPVVLNGLVIQNGKSSSSGGGIYLDGVLNVLNTTITGNFAVGAGGGIYTSSGSSLTLTNTTVSGNSASSDGGGVYVNNYCFCTTTNTTIAGNSAKAYGGVHVCFEAAFTVINTIISANYADTYPNVNKKLSSESFNNLIDYYPSFVCPPVFDSDGKLTNTRNIDLRLRSNSYAVNSGSNDGVVGITTDLDGKQRVYNGTVDIGAYEYQGERDDATYPTVVDTLNDSFDLDDDEWSLREAIYYAPKYVTITFAENLRGTITLTNGELILDKPLAIDGAGRITIDAEQKSRIMSVKSGTEEKPLVLDGLTLQNGKTSDSGGGISLNGALNIVNVTITGNSASNNGGGVFVHYDSSFTSMNSTISGNSASNDGGGVYANIYKTTHVTTGGIILFVYYGGYFTSTNTTISGNSAQKGGGVYIYGGGSSTLTNTTISGNFAEEGSGVYCYFDSFASYNSIIAANLNGNDIYQNYNGTVEGNNNLSPWSSWSESNNILYDASAPLFRNAENGDYRLAANSQAFDKGSNQYAFDAGMDETSTDLEGYSRFVCSSIDIGAYEYHDDRYEENDSFETASDLGAISSTQTYKDLIAGMFSDQDWYKFTLAQSKIFDLDVSLTCAQTTNKQTVDLYLYDATGVELARSVGVSGVEKISLSKLDAGTYYIKAYNANDVAIDAPYELTITASETSKTDLAFYQPEGWSDSVIVSTSSKATSSKTVCLPNQNVCLRFAYKSTEPIAETFTQQVYVDGELKKSYEIDGTANAVENGMIVGYTVGKLSAGEHTITVKVDATNIIKEADENNNERSFTITVLPDDKFESNDTRKTATDLGTLETPLTYTGLIAGAYSNMDYFKFTLASAGTADSYVEATYTHVTGRDDVNLYLYDESRQLVKSKLATGTERISLNGYAAGTYYAMAYNYLSVANNVDYSLTFVPPVTADLAFQQPTGWSDSIIVSTDLEATSSRTEFSTSESVSLRFAFYGNEALTETFVQEIYLDDELVTSYEVDGSSNDVTQGLDGAHTFGRLSAGEHTIKVKLDAINTVREKDEGNNERSITFTVLQSNDDEYEPNDSFETAYDFGTIKTPQTYDKLVAGMFGNQDWYKFALATNGSPESCVELFHTQVVDQAKVDLRLYDPSGIELATSTGSAAAEKISLNGLAAGTYYVCVYNSDSAALDVDYTLSITPSAYDLAFYQPDGWDDSVVVSNSSNKTSGKTVYSPTQNVYLRFAYKSMESIAETFTQQIYVDGKLKTSFEVDGSETDVVSGVDYTCLLGKFTAGEHTITVKLDGGNAVAESDETNNERSITITVLPDDRYESNNTRKSATKLGTLTSSQTYTGLIAGLNSNQDWYQFTLANEGTADSYVEATYAHITGRDDVNLYLYDANGKQLAKSKGATGTERISLEGRAAGTYYVMAYNYLSVDNNVDYALTFAPPATEDLAFYQPTGWSDSAFVTTSVGAREGKTTFLTSENVSLRFAFNATEALDETFEQNVYLDGELVETFEVGGDCEDVVGGLEFAYTFGRLSAGEHTISVKLDDTNAVREKDESNNERAFVVTILQKNDDQYESNDTRAKASNLGTITSSQTFDNLVAGMFSNKDWYKFTLTNAGGSDSSVELTYAHDAQTADVNLYLYNASGKLVAKSTGKTGTENISLGGLAAGTYYLKAYNAKNVSNGVDYALTITTRKAASSSVFDAALFRNAFADDSFTPFEEEDEFGFVEKFFNT